MDGSNKIAYVLYLRHRGAGPGFFSHSLLGLSARMSLHLILFFIKGYFRVVARFLEMYRQINIPKRFKGWFLKNRQNQAEIESRGNVEGESCELHQPGC